MTLEQKLESAKKQLLKSGFQLCDIEDALQDVVLKTLDKGDDLDTKPASWFAISAYRRAIDVCKHYSRTPLLADIEVAVDDDHELLDTLIDMNSTNTVLLS